MTENPAINPPEHSMGGMEQPQAAPAKVIDQNRINDIVRDAHERGRQKGYTQAMGEIPPAPHTAPVVDQEHINKIIDEKMKAHQTDFERAQLEKMQREEGDRILKEIGNSAREATGRYSDYDDVTSKVKWNEIPGIMHLAHQTGMSGDVLYDLAKNPSKIATLLALPPSLALMETKKLADSIKMNREAGNKELPPDPASPIKPSNLGNDKRPTSAADYRSKYKGRG